MKKSYIYILSALALCSCAKNAPVSSELESYPICFAMDNLGYSVKAPVESIGDITDVRIFGTLNSAPITGYQNNQISYDSNTNLWKLSSGNDAKWTYEAGSKNEYAFAAYSYVGDAIISDLTTSGDNFGTSFYITQPDAYNHNGGKGCGTDYLLSQVFNCTTTTKNDKIQASTVQLHMEHALACVEVWLTVNSNLTEATVQDVTLSGFYRTCKIPTHAMPYGGWEDSLIAGHGVGHYFSALGMRIRSLRGDRSYEDELSDINCKIESHKYFKVKKS